MTFSRKDMIYRSLGVLENVKFAIFMILLFLPQIFLVSINAVIGSSDIIITDFAKRISEKDLRHQKLCNFLAIHVSNVTYQKYTLM